MFKVTAVTTASDEQLNRLIKRLGILLAVGVIAFVGFYVVDRYVRLPQATIVTQEMAALEEAVRADPEDIPSRGRLADLYVANARYDEAIVQYSAILETGKADKPAYLGRAKAYQLSGNLAAATDDFDAVVAMAKDGEMANVDRQLQAAYYGLGAIALEEGRSAEAIDQLTKALVINRGDADALHLIGRAYTAAGETDKAIDALRRAVAFVPIGWPEPYTALAAAFAKAGDPAMAAWAEAMAMLAGGDGEGARAALGPLVGGSATVDAQIGLGLVAEIAGDTATAGEWYAQVLASDPENAEARLGMTRVQGPAEAQSQLPALPAPGELGGDN